MYFDHAFEGHITNHGVGKTKVIIYKVIFLPPEFENHLPFKQYPRLRVEGEIADVPVRGAWLPVGDGRRYFIISPGVLKSAEVQIGDLVEMRFRIDDQDYVDMPTTLKIAVTKNPDIAQKWDNLTPGKRRMFASHVASAKTPKTEQKRLGEALKAIRLECSLRDLRHHS
ncbi:MAG: YdeI/OmpD-associated family protein [Pseudomonadota bacterium]